MFGRKKKSAARRKPAKTLKDILNTAYLRELKKDPELLKKISFKEAGQSEFVKEDDPLEEKRKEITSRITDIALDKIKKDPELAERFAEQEIERIVGDFAGGKSYNFGDGNYSDDPIAQYIETTERLKEIKELGGGGSGVLGTILNSEMVKGVGPMLVALFTGKLPELQQQLQMGEAQQPAQLQTAPPASAPPETETEPAKAPPQQPPEAPPEAPMGLDLEMWVPYLDEVPEAFVAELNRLADEGNEQATLVLEVLRTKEVDEILEMLQPLKEQEEYREIIARLEDQEWWLAGVVELVRAEEPLNFDMGDG